MTSEVNENTNNHAVIVSSSRYWFNYRHVINALSFYQLCKANGIPDENIILMLADDIPSNARNPYKNGMYANGVDPTALKKNSLYDGQSIEIDYRGEDVTVDNLVKSLLGRQGEPAITTKLSLQQGSHPVAATNQRRHLQTDENSNILIYLTGHGGDQFFKFQDIEEITSEEIAGVLDEMHKRKRYKEVLLVADTCQAFTLGDHITAPNVMVIGSSLRGESSYAHHSDQKLGLSVIERYTHSFMTFLQKRSGGNMNLLGGTAVGNLTLQQAMVDPYPYYSQRAHIGFRTDLLERRHINSTRLSDFFANNQLLHHPSPRSSSSEIVLLPTEKTTTTTSNNNKNPLTIQSWPWEIPSTQQQQQNSEPMLSSATPQEQTLNTRQLNLGTESSSSELFGETLLAVDGPIPVYNPNDGPFVALLLALLGLVLILSKP